MIDAERPNTIGLLDTGIGRVARMEHAGAVSSVNESMKLVFDASSEMLNVSWLGRNPCATLNELVAVPLDGNGKSSSMLSLTGQPAEPLDEMCSVGAPSGSTKTVALPVMQQHEFASHVEVSKAQSPT